MQLTYLPAIISTQNRKMRLKKLLILGSLILTQSPALAGYNAIYYAPTNNIVGASYSQPTKKQAFRAARRQCLRRGGIGCKRVTWSNRCSSLYTSARLRGGYGTGWGNSRSEANRKAYRKCKQNNAYCIRRIAACEDKYED